MGEIDQINVFWCDNCNMVMSIGEVKYTERDNLPYHSVGTGIADVHWLKVMTLRDVRVDIDPSNIESVRVVDEPVEPIHDYVGDLLTELLILSASFTPAELKTMSTHAFNALTRVMKVADRLASASAGGATTAQSREDLVRERRDGQEPHRPPVLRRDAGPKVAYRSHNSEEAGFLGVVERSGEVGSRVYESEDAAGEPTVVDREAESPDH